MTTRPRVFVPQVPTRLDPDTGRPVPAFDLSPAERYGELVALSDLVSNPLSSLSDHRLRMLEVMEEHQLDSADYLLCAGNPVLIALAAALVADQTGRLRVLMWQRSQGRYELAEDQLWTVESGDQREADEPQAGGLAPPQESV